MRAVLLFSVLILLIVGWSKPAICQAKYFKVEVEDLCDHWKVCISATDLQNHGIKSITLLNDPDEDLVDKPNSLLGYVSYNARIDPVDDPNGWGEISFDTAVAVKCLTIRIPQPADTIYGAYAALLIVDNKGGYIVIELNHKPQPDLLLLFDPLVAKGNGIAPLIPQSTVAIGLANGKCTTLRIVNTNEFVDFKINALTIKHPDKNFKIICDSPLVFRAGDTTTIQICCTAKDTIFHYTKFELSSECYAPFVFTVSNQDTNKTLNATDIDFGKVLLGETAHKIATIQNTGSFPVLIGSGITFTDPSFKLEPSSKARLPIIVSVGDTVQFRISFSPTVQEKFLGQCNFPTNIPLPLLDRNKSFSKLSGIGVKPAVQWLSDNIFFIADSNVASPTVTKRIYLGNHSQISTYVDNVSFMLDTSAEFTISKNVFGYDSLQKFSLVPGDSIWLDVTFKPDLSRPYPFRYAERRAYLAATYFTSSDHTKGESALINITGAFNLTSAVPASRMNGITAYVLDHQIMISDPKQSDSFSLYDILGRKIYSWDAPQKVGYISRLPLPVITTGMYLLRTDSESIPLFIR